jgi:hypothetical protein
MNLVLLSTYNCANVLKAIAKECIKMTKKVELPGQKMRDKIMSYIKSLPPDNEEGDIIRIEAVSRAIYKLTEEIKGEIIPNRN